MNTERWERIRKLYDEWLESPREGRARFLDRACAGDAELRAEFESLLAQEREDSGFLEVPFAGIAPPDEPDALAAGSRLGRYRIEDVLGRGGMGTVYLAVREEPFRQRVAVKLIRRGLDTEDILRRFQTERQILAGFDHPHIARLLDGDATEDGRPYLVMEYVDGLPITDYCDRNRLTIDQRLRLFRQVCGAVHAAHQNLVVHRDLKPANILVTAAGAPKLLDFGIAKLLNPDLTGYTIPVTRLEQRILTPEYASPEQIRGEPISTASDVYSLGVLLFELLTGRLPYLFEHRSPAEIARIVTASPPDRPSAAVGRGGRARAPETGSPSSETPVAETAEARRTTPARLRRRIRGDLDNIVMMSMRPEPGRRYASAEALQEDLARHERGIPVSARPDTIRYRLSSFIRRNSLGVGVAAAFLALLIGFTAVTLVQSREIRERAVAADIARDKALRVTEFMLDLFRGANPYEVDRSRITAAEVVADGSRRIERELSGQPALQAEMMDALAGANAGLGIHGEARRLSLRSLAIRRDLYDADDPELVRGLIQAGTIERGAGNTEESEKLLREALAICRAHDLSAAMTASALASLGELLGRTNRISQAVPLLEESLALWRVEHEPGRTANVLTALSNCLRQNGERDRARVLLEEALRIEQERFGLRDLRTANTLNALANLHAVTESYEAADSLYALVLSIYAEHLEASHTHFAAVLTNRGRARLAAVDAAGALEHLREAWEIRRTAFGEDHALTASTSMHYGRALAAGGEAERGIARLRAAAAWYRKEYGAGDRRSALADVHLGVALERAGQDDEAERLLVAARETLEARNGADHATTRLATRTLALVRGDEIPEPDR